MHRWTIDSANHDRTRAPLGSAGGRERRRGMAIELLVGDLRLPGLLEYSAGDEQVRFTIIKKVPLPAPGES